MGDYSWWMIPNWNYRQGEKALTLRWKALKIASCLVMGLLPLLVRYETRGGSLLWPTSSGLPTSPSVNRLWEQGRCGEHSETPYRKRWVAVDLQDVPFFFLLITGGNLSLHELPLLHLLTNQKGPFHCLNTMQWGSGYVIHRLHLPVWCTSVPWSSYHFSIPPIVHKIFLGSM